ncbi:hypothetical protein GE061_004794 [Apolygus lucorum]|uniref:Uncharacterized protein n=1 Tax=Apolygus lucorum TaxID=248454 RepID=A0A8S9X475_APOLU|nr:hypothetical protein GE061_004794 [Apolygus lucorum]
MSILLHKLNHFMYKLVIALSFDEQAGNPLKSEEQRLKMIEDSKEPNLQTFDTPKLLEASLMSILVHKLNHFIHKLVIALSFDEQAGNPLKSEEQRLKTIEDSSIS